MSTGAFPEGKGKAPHHIRKPDLTHWSRKGHMEREKERERMVWPTLKLNAAAQVRPAQGRNSMRLTMEF